MGKQLIKVHASTAKRLCPYCRSHRLVYASNKELWEEGVVSRGIGPAEKYFVCLDCNKMFKINEARRSPNWDKEIRENQNEFQKSQFPFLVATKGYGMGIDKRNIRFIVHHALASGLGGYYLKAGRAGRIEKIHVALLYSSTSPSVENEH
jgi:ATP-dependent DNA helicase RecQ